MDGAGRRSRSPAEWESYEREDGANDGYGDQNRGADQYRRRSPGDRRGRGFRGRSRSPPGIDRYTSGQRDFPHRRDESPRRRAPNPMPTAIDRYVPGQEPPPPAVNPHPHPLSYAFQIPYTWYAEWWKREQEVKDEKERQKNGGRLPRERVRGEKESREERDREKAKIQADFDEYKEKWQSNVNRDFVNQHKSEEWFKERYDPDVRDPIRQRLSEFRRGNFQQWITDLSNGLFDDYTLEGIYKSDSNGVGGVIEKEEGEAMAIAEVLGVGDLLPMKAGELQDAAITSPTLLIKTIAPHVSRDQIQNFCKEHIGDGPGGFKWLSLSEPNTSKKCHRVGWIILNPGENSNLSQQKSTGDTRDDGREGDMDDDADAMKTESDQKPDEGPAHRACLAIDGKTITDEEKGSFTCHVGVHYPANTARKKALWDLFAASERIERDLDHALRLANKFEQEIGIDGISKIDERVEELRSNGQLQLAANGMARNGGLNGHTADDDKEDDMDVEEGAWDEDQEDESLTLNKKKLDLTVEYLRRVFNFCLFCVFEADSVHELVRKCPGGHLRRPRASLTSFAKEVAKASAYDEPFPLKKQDAGADGEEGDGTVAPDKRFNRNNKTHQQLQRAFNWVKTYEDKIFQILEPDSIDLKKIGGKSLEEGLSEMLKNFVKQEDEAKFRCKVPNCTKLFKGENFWRKHVEKRHAEWYESVVKDINLINAYALDPAHVVPPRVDQQQTSAQYPRMMTQPPQPQPGYPNYHMPLYGMPPAYPPAYQAYPAPYSHHPMQMPGPMAYQQPPYTMPMNPMGPGPMRRAPGGRALRPANPYDRPGGAGRGMPYPGPKGRVMSGLARFPDAMKGGQLGPKEAVAGRSLKSYEDLDAAGGGAGGELDY